MRRTLYGEDHEAFRRTARDFLAKEVVPHFADWEKAGMPPREIFRALGDLGVMGLRIPEEYGGGGEPSFLYPAVWIEETAAAHVHLGGFNVHTNVVLPYFLGYADAEQRKRWLPGMASGETLAAIAMTEPGTGSDLAGIATTAERVGDHYVLNGSKTFITGGINADVVVVVARTGRTEDRRGGLTLLVVERGMAGFTRGTPFDKIGLKVQDTTDLFFDGVEVPVANRLGEEGAAFRYLTGNLPQERLHIAATALATAEAAVALTADYVTGRKVFGKPVSSFQNTRFELAACATEAAAGRALVDQALVSHDAGELTGVDAAKLKIFCTELQGRVVDRCLQLFGGYGYITESPIARMYADARVSRIYGGSTEVLKTIVAKSLGL
ncbi:acyl-CoA dehydrogenase family protein [Pseudonocardia sp. RS11V-5]|uniref:acyl-CoA dehydrogenase family protein n=1 Tax=Pseudonocardia terrae TaxID=2905831 RepID=UPI001E548128|nr:acyl-CoA dehydrogenase family protein [Pseudonocardia terrae]MCE3555926.1 acyl-CoA dehydrogenase family protein [Pseudonocardia terrae]